MILGTTLATALLVSGEPDPWSCSWGESIVAEFRVRNVREIGERIPALATAPEIAHPMSIREDGRPAGLAGPIDVLVMQCVRYNQLPISPFVPGYVPPEFRSTRTLVSRGSRRTDPSARAGSMR
jgi:hypothetical protein